MNSILRGLTRILGLLVLPALMTLPMLFPEPANALMPDGTLPSFCGVPDARGVRSDDSTCSVPLRGNPTLDCTKPIMKSVCDSLANYTAGKIPTPVIPTTYTCRNGAIVATPAACENQPSTTYTCPNGTLAINAAACEAGAVPDGVACGVASTINTTIWATLSCQGHTVLKYNYSLVTVPDPSTCHIETTCSGGAENQECYSTNVCTGTMQVLQKDPNPVADCPAGFVLRLTAQDGANYGYTCYKGTFKSWQ